MARSKTSSPTVDAPESGVIPSTPQEIYPAKPVDSRSAPDREAMLRGQELARGLREERRLLEVAQHQRVAELVEVFTAGGDPGRVLDAVAAAGARLREIDDLLPSVQTASGRLSRIHSAAMASDPQLAAWRAECAAIQERWHKVMARVDEDHQSGPRPLHRGSSESREAVERWDRLAQAREAASIAARLDLAEDVQAGRFRR